MSLLNTHLVIEDGIVRRIQGTSRTYCRTSIADIQQLFDEGVFSQNDRPLFHASRLGSYLIGLLVAVINGELVYRPVLHNAESTFTRFPPRLISMGEILFEVEVKDNQWTVKVLDNQYTGPEIPTIIRKPADRGAEFSDLLCDFGEFIVSRNGQTTRISTGHQVIADIPMNAIHCHATQRRVLLADAFQLVGYELTHTGVRRAPDLSLQCEVAQIYKSTILMKDGTIWRHKRTKFKQIDAIKPLAPTIARKPALFCRKFDTACRLKMSLLSNTLAIDNGKVREIGKGGKYSSEFIAGIQKFFDDGTFEPRDEPIYCIRTCESCASCFMIAVKDGKVVHRTASHGDFEDDPELLGVVGGVVFKYWMKDNQWDVEAVEIADNIGTLPFYDGDTSYTLTSDGRAFLLSLDDDGKIMSVETKRGAEFDELLDNFGKVIASRNDSIVRLSKGSKILAEVSFENDTPFHCSIIGKMVLLADRVRLLCYLVKGDTATLRWYARVSVLQICGGLILTSGGTIWKPKWDGLVKIDTISL